MKQHELLIKIGSALDGSLGTNFMKIKKGIEGTQGDLEKLSKIKQMEVDIKGFEKTQGKLDKLRAKNQLLNEKIVEYTVEMGKAEKGSEAYNKIEAELKDLQKEQQRTLDQEKKLNLQSEVSERQLRANGINVKNLNFEKNKLSKTSQDLKGKIDKLSDSQNKNKKIVSDSEGVYGKFGAIAKAVVGPAVVAGISNMGMQFSSSVAQIATVADSSQVSMQQMGIDVLKLSKDTGIAAELLSKDVYDAISSGVQTSDSVKTVATNSKLAKAGFAESSQSLDLLTTIVNGYGKSMKEADKISDILINTQNKGKVTVAQLSTSMGKIIPTANASNVSLEQVASGYAIMTSKGIAAAESTTYMNSMINELSKSGTGANKALKKITGKSFQDLMKDGKSLSDVLGILEANAKKNKKNLTDMFGSAEAGKAALVLATNSGKDFNDMVKSMENSSGATQDAFDKLNAEPLEKFKKSANNLKVKGIELGMAMLPMVDKIITSLLKLTELPIQPVLDWFVSGSESSEIFKAVVIGLTIAIGGYALGLQAVTAWTKISAGSQVAWNAVMNANPIGVTVVALMGLVAGLTYAYKHSETFRMYVDAAWATIKEFGSDIMKLPGKVKEMWGNGAERARVFREDIGKLWAKLTDNPIAQTAGKILELLNPFNQVIAVAEKVGGWWDKLFGGGKATKEIQIKTTYTGQKTGTKTNGVPYGMGNIPKYAKGGLITKPTVAEVGEGGDSEMIIPINNSARSKELFFRTADLLGFNKGNKEVSTNLKKPNTNSITNNKLISKEVKTKETTVNTNKNTIKSDGITIEKVEFKITIQGAVENVKKATELGKEVGEKAFESFDKKLKEFQRNKGRLSFE